MPSSIPSRSACRTGDEVEGLHERVERAVRRAVVDDHHLVTRVAEREQRAHALDDHGLLVERRHEHRDAGREWRPEQLVEARGSGGAAPRASICIQASAVRSR